MANLRPCSGAKQLLAVRQVKRSHREDLLDQDLKHLGRFWGHSTRNGSMPSKECDDIVDVGCEFCGHGNVVACDGKHADVFWLEQGWSVRLFVLCSRSMNSGEQGSLFALTPFGSLFKIRKSVLCFMIMRDKQVIILGRSARRLQCCDRLAPDD